MRFTRGDVTDHIVSSKIDHRLRSGIEKPRSSREVQRSTLARFLGLFDFRLLQQYRSKADLMAPECDFRYAPESRLTRTSRSVRFVPLVDLG
jgi:hypothetical protein